MALTREEILALDIRVQGGAKARRELDKTADATKKAAKTTETANKRAESSFTEVRKSVARMRNMVLLTTFAISATVVAIDRLAKKAEALRGVTIAFDTLTERANVSADAMVAGMRRASRGFVTDAELMKQANNALVLGLPVTAEAMEEVVDIAVKLGRAMGLDATRSIESVVTGIGRQSRLMLDNVGIVLSATEANIKYADALGIEVEALTKAQQTQAFMNEFLFKGRPLAKSLADDGIVPLSDRYLTLSTRIKNTTNELILFFNAIGSNDLQQQIDAIGLTRFSTSSQGLGDFSIAQVLFRMAGGEGQIADAQIRKLTEQIDKARDMAETMKGVDAVLSGINAETGMEKTLRLQEDLAAAADRWLNALREIAITKATLPGLFDDVEPGPGAPLSLDTTDPDFGSLDSHIDLDKALEEFEAFEISRTELEEREAAARIEIARNEQLQKISFQEQLSGAVFALGAAIFGDNKVFAIAESIIQTHLAVVKTLASVPYPANLAAAAQVKTLGILNTAAIAATSFGSRGGGGGGGGFSGGGGGGLPFVASNHAGPTAPAQGPVEIRVFLEGEGFFQISPEELAQQIGEEYARQAGRAGVVVGGFVGG